MPEPCVPLAWARVADQLGASGGRHRRRRRAVRSPPVGPRPRPLAPRPLPLDQGTAHGSRGLRRDLRDERDRVDHGVEASSVPPRPLRPQHPGRRLGDRAEHRAPLRERRPADRRDTRGHRGGRRHRPRPCRVDRRVVLRRGQPVTRARARRARAPLRDRRRAEADRGPADGKHLRHHRNARAFLA